MRSDLAELAELDPSIVLSGHEIDRIIGSERTLDSSP
jgi:hypothetical protein